MGGDDSKSNSNHRNGEAAAGERAGGEQREYGPRMLAQKRRIRGAAPTGQARRGETDGQRRAKGEFKLEAGKNRFGEPMKAATASFRYL